MTVTRTVVVRAVICQFVIVVVVVIVVGVVDDYAGIRRCWFLGMWLL